MTNSLFTLITALMAFAMALITLFAAVGVFPFKEKGRSKYKWLPVSIGCLALAGGFTLGGITCLQDWDTQPAADEGHAGIVQKWAEDIYGVSVSGSEADAMADAIRYDRPDETFVVEGPSGVIQVKLVQDGDAEFHMVQAAAELPLSEVQK